MQEQDLRGGVANVGFGGGVGSASERNTLIFKERWSVRNEISPASIFYEQTEVRDMG